jgi:hypothetical protein
MGEQPATVEWRLASRADRAILAQIRNERFQGSEWQVDELEIAA